MDLIECNKDKCSGEPSLVGKRLTVGDVVSKLRIENNLEVTLEDYGITHEQAKAALEYCRTRTCQSAPTLLKYCHNCVLRTIQDGELFDASNYHEEVLEEGKVITVANEGGEIFLGTKKEAEQEFMGRAVWEDAKKMWEKYF